MKINEIISFLVEDRSDWVKANFGGKIIDAARKNGDLRAGGAGQEDVEIDKILNKIKEADPQNGANIIWLAKQYANGGYRLEDVGRLRGDLEVFAAAKRRPEFTKKDLNAYMNLRELYAAIEPFKEPEDAAAKEFLGNLGGGGVNNEDMMSVLANLPNTKTLINTPNFVVTIPENLEASKKLCKLGGNTRWCTQNTDQFAKYSSDGPLYVLLVRSGDKIKKYQFHVESDQYMDKDDNSIVSDGSPGRDIKLLSSIPEYTKFLNYLIKKHYGKYLEDSPDSKKL